MIYNYIAYFVLIYFYLLSMNCYALINFIISMIVSALGQATTQIYLYGT